MADIRSDYTLLDVINAVDEFADTDVELLATVAHLVNSGKIRLCGELAGSRIEIVKADSSQLGAA